MRVIKRLRAGGALLAALLVAAPAAVAASTHAPRAAQKARTHRVLLGVMDDALLANDPDTAFAAVAQLEPRIIRFDADWPQIARRKPHRPRDPADPAYDFSQVDQVVLRAHALDIPVLLTIVHTPAWAGGTRRHNHAPKRLIDLERFAYAVATRYSGRYELPDGTTLPRVSRWLAWNEPNTQTHLAPQWRCIRGRGFWCRGGHFVPSSPRLYAGILKAIYTGVHAAGKHEHVWETVAGGVTKPTGEGPTAHEPSIAPLRFLRLLAKHHPRFDVYAHHPYRSPFRHGPPRGDNVGLENIGSLLRTLDRLFRPRRYHLWLTEFAVQTNPPDRFIGVSPARQVRYLRQAVSIARHDRRIDLLIWFLIRDEAVHGRFASGFQSGLAYVDGRTKPAFRTFRALARSADRP